MPPKTIYRSDEEDDIFSDEEECAYCTKIYKIKGMNRHLASCELKQKCLRSEKIDDLPPRRSYTKEERMYVWGKINGGAAESQCAICHRKTHRDDHTTWHMSHIISRSRGGTDELRNIRPICAKCNNAMRDIPLPVYSEMHGKKDTNRKLRI